MLYVILLSVTRPVTCLNINPKYIYIIPYISSILWSRPPETAVPVLKLHSVNEFEGFAPKLCKMIRAKNDNEIRVTEKYRSVI